MKGLTKMKFYSDVTKKFYNSADECEKEENALQVELAAKAAKEDKLKKERKQRAEEVDAAYKNYMKLLNAFMKDYGSYHTSFKSDDGLFTDFFKYAFTW